MKEKSYHFIGIGGIGMSALARIAASRGAQVSGSDNNTTGALIAALKKSGIRIYSGHAKENLETGATIIYSTGIAQDNPELQAASALNLPLFHRSQMLADLMEDKCSLLVCGTHGKTTTSSLLAHLLIEAGLEPSYAVGGIVKNRSTNGELGIGVHFVAEADESDGSFLTYSGNGAIVTNIDWDHMDYWKSKEKLIEGFTTFINGIKEADKLFFCADDPLLCQIAKKGISYGKSADADLRITNNRSSALGEVFDCTFQGKQYKEIFIPLIGAHNVLNSAAVFGLGLQLGIAQEVIKQAFATFSGIGRRLEKRAEVSGVSIFDDYGHHPTEVATTLKGFKKSLQGRRLVVIFQPHRYSRTADCLELWGSALNEADELIVTDIYGAGEKPIEGINREIVVEAIRKNCCAKIHSVPRDELLSFLATFVRPHDVCLTSGAGDITQVAGELADHLEKFPAQKYQLALVFGGRSNEHKVSLSSAAGILKALNTNHYDLLPIGLSTSLHWIAGDEALDKLKKTKVDLVSKPYLSPQVLERLQQCDVVLPILHGPFGEDGVLQGFLDMLGIAYVGCDHRASAVCMDKAMTKKIALHHGLKVASFVEMNADKWKQDPEKEVARVLRELSFPLFVKASYFGSSRGVYQVFNELELKEAFEKVFEISANLIVEQKVYGREIEIALLGNSEPFIGTPGEILTGGEVYSLEKKYGPGAMGAAADACLEQSVKEKGMELALRLYEALGCTGLCRIDFFLTKENQWIFNEANPIPGFTPTSLYPQIMEGSGIGYQQLLDRLIICALERKRKSDRKIEASLKELC